MKENVNENHTLLSLTIKKEALEAERNMYHPFNDRYEELDSKINVYKKYINRLSNKELYEVK